MVDNDAAGNSNHEAKTFYSGFDNIENQVLLVAIQQKPSNRDKKLWQGLVVS